MPSPAGISDPIAIAKIPVWQNNVQMDAVSSIDSSARFNRRISPLLSIMCLYNEQQEL